MQGNSRIPFPKHWTDIPAQLALLASRGLVVNDVAAAAAFLSYANYYRFTGYCLRFQSSPNAVGVRLFQTPVTFDDVRTLYEWDRDLRDVFSSGLELVEISIRSAIASEFGRTYDAMGHLDPSHFVSRFSVRANVGAQSPFDAWLENLRREVRRSRELFVTHFRNAYAEYPDLPIWMTCEIASFGSISRFFENMLRSEQRAIANRYGLQPSILDSWLHAFVYMRNVCAHHARLWDKSMSITPSIPPGKRWNPVRATPNNALFPAAMTLNWMLTKGAVPSAAAQAWRDSLDALMKRMETKFPNLVSHTGFPQSWRSADVWTGR